MEGDPHPEIPTSARTKIQTQISLLWNGRRSRHRDSHSGMDGDPDTEILTVAWTEIQTQRSLPWSGRRSDIEIPTMAWTEIRAQKSSPWRGQRSRHKDPHHGMDGDPDRVGAGEGSRHLALVSGVHREGDHTSCREHLGQHHAA